MSNFLSELRVSYIDGKRWSLLERFSYHVGSADGPETIECPVGMITDFASSPRLVKLFWPSPGGPWDKPAVIHDKLYKDPTVSHVDGTQRLLHRGECDAIFDEAMKVTKTPIIPREAHYRGVRVGGWLTWRRYRKQDKERQYGNDNSTK